MSWTMVSTAVVAATTHASGRTVTFGASHRFGTVVATVDVVNVVDALHGGGGVVVVQLDRYIYVWCVCVCVCV